MKYFEVSRNFQVLTIIFRGSFSYISSELYIFIACLSSKHHFFQQINCRFQRNSRFPGMTSSRFTRYIQY